MSKKYNTSKSNRFLEVILSLVFIAFLLEAGRLIITGFGKW